MSLNDLKNNYYKYLMQNKLIITIDFNTDTIHINVNNILYTDDKKFIYNYNDTDFTLVQNTIDDNITHIEIRAIIWRMIHNYNHYDKPIFYVSVLKNILSNLSQLIENIEIHYPNNYITKQLFNQYDINNKEDLENFFKNNLKLPYGVNVSVEDRYDEIKYKNI